MTRVADAVWQIVKEAGVDTVFFLPGGGASYLVDALGKSGLRAVNGLHEQGVGYEAVGYSAFKPFGVCLVTSGPGMTNCMTPIYGAFGDSYPLIVIAGQSPSNQLIGKSGLRMRGIQEVNAVGITSSTTKMSAEPTSAEWAIKTLRNMIAICQDGRCGPCVLSVPQDIQGAEWNG